MRQYHKELTSFLAGLTTRPTLLLHACCAPCSTGVLAYLAPYFTSTVFYYNPNISPETEFIVRRDEAEKTAAHFGAAFVAAPWENEAFEAVAKNLQDQPEGGRRCQACFALRLEKTAAQAKARGCEFFTTTLSISPLKNAALLNEIGEAAALRHGVHYLPSDFKKGDGYQRSVRISKELGLYRQNYCGCLYSKGREEHASQTERP